VPGIKFVQGLPDDILDSINPETRNVYVIDDFMGEKDGVISKLFTKKSHHGNLSVIYVVQNLFHHSKEHRTISKQVTVLPRNKLTLRFGRGSCGLRSRFVRFAVAIRSICGRGSFGLRSRFVKFAVAVCAFFSPTAENHGVVFRRFPTTTIIIRFLITRFIFQYCDYICRSSLSTM
jgi:hypothetical protein